MSGIGGASGAGRPDLEALMKGFADEIDGAAAPGSAWGERVSEPEVERALRPLAAAGPLDVASRMDVMRAIADKSLTEAAKGAVLDFLVADVARSDVGSVPAAPADPAAPVAPPSSPAPDPVDYGANSFTGPFGLITDADGWEKGVGPMGVLPGTSAAGAALAHDLADVAKDMWYSSESDYRFQPFAAPLPAGAALTPETFLAAAGFPPSTAVSASDASEYFADLQDPSYGGSPDDHAAAAALEARFGTLTDVQRIYVFDDSVVEAPVYIVGRTADGEVVGLTSTRIWT